MLSLVISRYDINATAVFCELDQHGIPKSCSDRGNTVDFGYKDTLVLITEVSLYPMTLYLKSTVQLQMLKQHLKICVFQTVFSALLILIRIPKASKLWKL